MSCCGDPTSYSSPGRVLLAEIVALGEREGVRVRSKAFVGAAKENAILRQATLGGHQLIVLRNESVVCRPIALWS